MILKGNQRAGAKELTYHLLNTRDNDHITVHEVSGFVSNDVVEAFNEAYAISQATRCKQYLFSLSLNPPEQESVPVRDFETAISLAEQRLGLSGQPRAIIFHEKEGRRHAHCVWSRIEVGSMTAIQLSHYKKKLTGLSRELYLEHDWHMPTGLKAWDTRQAKPVTDHDPVSNDQNYASVNSSDDPAANPTNFSLAQWQQAKRAKADPREIKRIFQECWKQSDEREAFQSALSEHGYILARGDRRGHVAVDWRGEVYAVSRWVGVKAKLVRERLGDVDGLPTVSEANSQTAERDLEKLQAFADEARKEFEDVSNAFGAKRMALVSEQRAKRRTQKAKQESRQIEETRKRASKLPTGLKALWFRLTGRYAQIKAENEREYEQGQKRDRAKWQTLIDRQLEDRKVLKVEFELTKNRLGQQRQDIEDAKLAFNPKSDEGTAGSRSEQRQGRRRRRRQLRPD
ncbi:MAG: relaxase [Pseudomonadota bacterium]